MIGWLKNQMFGLTQSAPPRDPRTSRSYHTRGAGLFINPDVALTLSTVWACTRYISGTIGYLPWTVQRAKARMDGKMALENMPLHPVSRLLHRKPNQQMSAMTWRETMVHWALLWGNGYAEIERDKMGRPLGLWQIEPDRVDVRRSIDTGELYYRVSNGWSTTAPAFVEIPANNMYHLHGLGFDGLVGYGIVAYAARSIGLGVAAENFGAGFYENNAVPGGTLQHPERLSEEAAARLKKAWEETLKGSRNANKTVVLEEGMEWKMTTIPPEQAQFLETRQFSVKEICRWFGLPPTKVADLESATYNNVENLNREVVNDALMPWITRLEQEADYKLLSSGHSGLQTTINVNALLRGDSESRGKFYKEQFSLGAISPNEIREAEGRNPIPDGDRYFVPTNNVTPLDRVDEAIDNAQKPSPLEDAATKSLETDDSEGEEEE